MDNRMKVAENHALEAVTEAGRQTLFEILGQASEIEDLGAVADCAERLITGLTATSRLINPVTKRPACAMGCYYCCTLKVETTVPEVARVVLFLQEHYSPSEREELIERLSQAEARVKGLDDERRADLGLLCPLVVEGSCSVHAAKPLVCRAYVSYDRRICEANFANPKDWQYVPGDVARPLISSAVSEGLAAAMRERGLADEFLELIGAVRIALENPNAFREWLDGGNPFAESISVSTETEREASSEQANESR